jgi:hypothetical protein
MECVPPEKRNHKWEHPLYELFPSSFRMMRETFSWNCSRILSFNTNLPETNAAK